MVDCEYRKKGFCEKLNAGVDDNFCNNHCGGNPVEWRQKNPQYREKQPDHPFYSVCRKCEYFRHSCKTGSFCLLCTRQYPLPQVWRRGCPARKFRQALPPDNDVVSVIITSRAEKYLNPTLRSLIDNAFDKIEIVVVLDGPPCEQPIEDARIKYIHHTAPAGRRPSINEACRMATGKYLLHVDGHVWPCAGYDRLLKQACSDDHTMVVANLTKLDAENFRSVGNGMGHKYISHKFKDVWSHRKPVQPVEETVCGNGMGWFLQRDYYWALGGCDENLAAIWGSFGVEWALKVWLTDPDGRGPGRVVIARDAVIAHMWKPRVGYPTPGVGKTRQRLKDMYMNFKAPGQVRPLSFIEDNFSHLFPAAKRINDDNRPLRVMTELPSVTAIMNTNGLYPELIEEAIYSFLQQDYPHKKLLIVNTNPQPLRVATQAGNIEIHNIKPFERFPQQMAYAIGQVKTDYWCIMDSDDIFFRDHISQLVAAMKAAKKQGLKSPGYVIVPRAWEQWHNNIPHQRHRGWWCCLYDRVDGELVDKTFAAFLEKNTKDTGSDLYFIKQPWWHKQELPEARITVLHRLGVGFHIRRCAENVKHYRQGIKLAQNNPLPELLHPHWRQDYYRKLKHPKRYTVYSANHLGDAICMEPFLRAYKRDNPTAELYVYTKWPELFRYHPLVSYSGHVDKCLYYDVKLHVHKRTHLCTWLCQDAAVMPPADLKPYVYLGNDDRDSISHFNINRERPTIAFSIRTHAINKRWAKQRWMQVREYAQRLGFQTIQLGQNERNIHADYNLVDKTNVIQAAAILQRCQLLISLDHGLTHLAVAVGTPAIVLHGPAAPMESMHTGWTYPVYAENSCRECWYKTRIGHKCPYGDAVCMFDIQVDDVKKQLNNFLRTRNGNRKLEA